MFNVINDWLTSVFGTDGLSKLNATSWTIGGQSWTLLEWLSCTGTLVILGVLIFTAFKFVWWLVRLIGNSFMMRR